MNANYLRVSPGQPSEVTVKVPERFPFQLVYRQERRQQFPVQSPSGVRFVLVDGLASGLANFPALTQIFGVAGAVKTLVKVCTSRLFYFAAQDRDVLHTGWISISMCHYYRVQSGDVVIGPIWSADACRGRGIGSFATQMAMNAMVTRGHSVFFIDTDNTNVSCQRLIEKCEFGDPVATYLR